MPRTNDNWERLVAAVIKKQQLLELFHAHSRTPSVLSDASDFSSTSALEDVSFGYLIPGASSSYSTMNLRNQVSTQTEMNKLVFLGDGNPTFDLEDLLRSSAEVLGNGTFGTSYKVILEDGNLICVKRLKDVIVTNKDFQQHMEIIGRMRHKNAAELTAYYYSSNEKLLVYDYYNQGSLSAALHGSRDSEKRHLDWKVRLKIAISAAKGIAHVHTRNGQKLVHGNIRASNILLNEQHYAIVTEVGLGKLVSPSVTLNEGYCAPKSTSDWKVSQASDVYSFGVVLLELLSGMAPEMIFQREFMSLADWIQGFVIDGLTTAAFDAEVWRGGEVKEEMVGMMQIAMDCVVLIPKRRPKMTDVVKKLKGIQRTEL